VGEDGTRYPLGIPLHVRATYVDVSVGWESTLRHGAGSRLILPYVGAGAGLVKYSERSPFAQPGDDLDTTAASYHVVAGAEVRLLRWLGVAGDVRLRFVPGILGDDGVSAVLDDDGFHGVQASVGLRIGLRRTREVQSPAEPPAPTRPAPDAVLAEPQSRATAVMSRTAPVFLRPDATRQPLRMLEAGTAIEVLETTDQWVRIAFDDRALGRRIGYVQRQDVRLHQAPQALSVP
jgi:hypothetical protein